MWDASCYRRFKLPLTDRCSQMVLFSPMLKAYFPLNSELKLIGSNYLRKTKESNMFLNLCSGVGNLLGKVESFHSLSSWNFSSARHMTRETRYTHTHTKEFLAPGPLATVTTQLWQCPFLTQHTQTIRMKKEKERKTERKKRCCERSDAVSVNLFLGDIKVLQKGPVMGAQNAEKKKAQNHHTSFAEWLKGAQVFYTSQDEL